MSKGPRQHPGGEVEQPEGGRLEVAGGEDPGQLRTDLGVGQLDAAERVQVVAHLRPGRLAVPGQQHQEVPQREPVHEVDPRQVLAAPVPLHADQQRGQELSVQEVVGLGVRRLQVGRAGDGVGHPRRDVGAVEQHPGPVEPGGAISSGANTAYSTRWPSS